jgi:hypothetical protein
MPGHLFALLDHLQWHHPTIKRDIARLQHIKSTTAVKGKRKGFCNFSPSDLTSVTPKDEYTCPLGCPNTKLVGFTASGYGGDAYNIYSRLRDGLLHGVPIQAFPTVLGARKAPPCK